MISNHLNSLVFVGGEFATSMFDERLLFNGKLDANQFKAGVFGNFSYSSGACQFAVTPDRIDLRCSESAVMPETLVEAGQTIVGMFSQVDKLARVSGFGMNCDTVFDRDYIGVSGRDFCMALIDPSVKGLIDTAPTEAFERIRFANGGIRYDIRMEPHLESDGQHLFVGVNAHQKVESSEHLLSKLEQIEGFRLYVGKLHGRIGRDKGNV